MNKYFASRANEVEASEVRELLKLTQNKDIISFGGGLPGKETFPVEEMKKICEEVINEYGASSMQYGPTEGHMALRQVIVKLLEEKGCSAAYDEVIVTSGSQQALDLTAKVFLEEGDIVLCESPTYLSAMSAFKPFGAKFVEVEMDEDGLCIEDLEKKLASYPKVKFLYTIPDYQNPTGIQMSLERRKRLIDCANQHDLLIIEDNPYSELCYDGNRLPPIKYFDTEERVVYLSTFSKVVCPGFRTGWVYGNKEIVSKYTLFKQGTDLHTNSFTQLLIAHFYTSYDVKQHIEKSIQIYRKRKDTMVSCIETYFPREVSYTNPKGGLFLWVTLPHWMDSRIILERAIERGVAFVNGSAFYPNPTQFNHLRLNFSSSEEATIEKGIQRLGEVIKEVIKEYL